MRQPHRLDIGAKIANFANFATMLGFPPSNKRITGDLAREIRERLIRIKSNSLSEEDKERFAMQTRKTDYVLVEE